MYLGPSFVQERAHTIVGSKEATVVGEKAKVLESAHFE